MQGRPTDVLAAATARSAWRWTLDPPNARGTALSVHTQQVCRGAVAQPRQQLVQPRGLGGLPCVIECAYLQRRQERTVLDCRAEAAVRGKRVWQLCGWQRPPVACGQVQGDARSVPRQQLRVLEDLVSGALPFRGLSSHQRRQGGGGGRLACLAHGVAHGGGWQQDKALKNSGASCSSDGSGPLSHYSRS